MQTLEPVDSSRHYTLEEFWALPEGENPTHYSLIAGLLYVIPPPEPPHGHLVSDFDNVLV